jgi:O-antigen ligase
VIKLTPNKLLTAMLLGVVMLQFAQERRGLPRDPKRPWIVFFAVALGVSALQSILAGVPLDGVRRMLTTLYSLILFYFMLSYAMRTRDEMDLLMRWFAVGSVVTVLMGLLGSGVEDGRLAGEGSSPNLLAFNLLVATSGAAALHFSARTQRSRWLYRGLIAVMTAGVVGTLSRSAYVAVVVMAGLWAVRFRRVGFIQYALPGLVLLVLAAVFAPKSAVERVETLTPEGFVQDESALGRIKMFGETYRAFASNPITGVGLAGYIEWAVRHEDEPGGIHSAFLNLLAEQGLLGFVPFAAITILSWREFTRAWRRARRLGSRSDEELRALELRALFLQIGFAGALVMSLAQPSMHNESLWLLFALSTVVLTLVRERERSLAPQEEGIASGWDPLFAASRRLAPPLDAGTR